MSRNLPKLMVGVAAILIAGCGRNREPVQIEVVRHETDHPAVDSQLSSAARFGYRTGPREGSGADMGAAARTGTASPLHWSAPPGWVRGPARQMREVTYYLNEDQTAECYVTVLPGAAGGTAANLNRWCGQMGQPALTDAQIAELPQIECIGQAVPLLVLSGTYRGMGDVEISDSLFAGVVVDFDGKSVFVKMVGPQADVEPHLDGFKAFCASLHDGRGHSHGGPGE